MRFKRLVVKIRNFFRTNKARKKSGAKSPSKKRLQTVTPEVLLLEDDSESPQKSRSKALQKGGSKRRRQTAESDLPQISALQAIADFSAVQLSEHTRRAYEKDLKDFFGFLRAKRIWEHWNDEVSPVLVAEYRDELLKGRGLAKSSITRKIAVVKSFFKWAQGMRWIDYNPADLVRSFPQTQESKTGFLQDQEVDTFLRYFSHADLQRLSFRLAKVGIETLLMLGLRRSEACAIRMSDLEFNDGRWLIKIRGKGDRDRTLPLPPRLLVTWAGWLARIFDDAPKSSFAESPAEWLDWLKRRPEQPLLISTRSTDFHSPLSPTHLGLIVRKYAFKAGLHQRVSPHMLRATAITHALDQGASHRGVQQMAGWTSPLMITRYDKRRKDPRISAVHDLKYAKEESE